MSDGDTAGRSARIQKADLEQICSRAIWQRSQPRRARELPLAARRRDSDDGHVTRPAQSNGWLCYRTTMAGMNVWRQLVIQGRREWLAEGGKNDGDGRICDSEAPCPRLGRRAGRMG
jgi:hypothetical protein